MQSNCSSSGSSEVLGGVLSLSRFPASTGRFQLSNEPTRSAQSALCIKTSDKVALIRSMRRGHFSTLDPCKTSTVTKHQPHRPPARSPARLPRNICSVRLLLAVVLTFLFVVRRSNVAPEVQLWRGIFQISRASKRAGPAVSP